MANCLVTRNTYAKENAEGEASTAMRYTGHVNTSTAAKRLTGTGRWTSALKSADFYRFANPLGRGHRPRYVPMSNMKSLTKRQFDRLARELFGGVLSPHGFTCEDSKRCTFVRRINDEVFHIILPDPGTRCAWYDINVFPTSPRFYDDFDDKFPDDLGFTLDSWSKLSETAGIGLDQQQFNCKYESNMRNRFAKTVAGLLTGVAIPFLDKIQTYDDILPHLRGAFTRFKNGS